MIAGLVLTRPSRSPWPALEQTLLEMRSVLAGRIVVALGTSGEDLLLPARLRGVEFVTSPRSGQGPAASLARGLAALEQEQAVVAALADEPPVSAAAIGRVVAGRGLAPAVRAAYDGRPGHPVLLEQRLFSRFRDVPGDYAARNLLMSMEMHEVPCGDLGQGSFVESPAGLLGLGAVHGL